MATEQQPSSQSTGSATPAPEKPTYSDSSGAIFSMYIDRAKKFDKENVDNWDGHAKGILLFSGIFSSTVATFIAISYPNLQQDPAAIQSLLAQISQQLANATTNGSHTDNVSQSTQIPFVPPSSVVFINSVWFLSLVLTLTCALIATLMQEWSRRHLQMVQRTRAPYLSARIREYFVQGARKFGINALVEVLPTLLLSSVVLFFAGLVVFAFRANHIVAYFTLATVAFFSLSYVTLTLMPLLFPDCPYHTPPTSLIWYGYQIILFIVSYAAHHCAKGLRKLEKLKGVVRPTTEETVKSLENWHGTKARSIKEGLFYKFESSAIKLASMDMYLAALSWTLGLLDKDSELEEFVSGIPGLRESEALAPYKNDNDPERTIRAVVAALPGPTSFHAPLPWTIIRLAQRAMTSCPSEPIPRQRIKACLKALYFIPGAIRDLLVPYSANKTYCLEILPLLNSIESLEIIDELWDTPRDDVALSVRCAAAVVSSFMITPPRSTLDKFLPSNVPFIGDIPSGKLFLSKRLAGARTSASSGVATNSDFHSDNARLQNIGCSLEHLIMMLRYIEMPWWATESAQSINQERCVLSDARTMPVDLLGPGGIFEQHGNRESPAFVPAVQQDLIILTLEIISEYSVAGATPSQGDAFRDTYTEILEVAHSLTLLQTPEQSHVQSFAQALTKSLLLSWGTSFPRPPTQVLGPTRTLSLPVPHHLSQSLVPQYQLLASSLLQPMPQFLAQCIPLSQSPPLARETTRAASSSTHVDGVEMATRVPQQVGEGVGIRPQPDGQTTVHDHDPHPLPPTPAIPQAAASAGPSRLSRVSFSLLPPPSLLPTANPGDRGLPDSTGALV